MKLFAFISNNSVHSCLWLQVYDFLKAFLVDLKHTFVDGYIHLGLDEVKS